MLEAFGVLLVELRGGIVYMIHGLSTALPIKED